MTVLPDAPSPSKLFASLPRGAKQWIRAFGRSMVPLFFSGDDLLVERCDEGELHAGDIAVMSSGRAALIAHVVRSVQPFVTASYLGVADRERFEVLGKVIAVKRLGRRLLFPRAWVLAGHRLLSLPEVHRAGKAVLDALIRSSVPVRRLLAGDVAVRRVEAEELTFAVEQAAGVLGGGVVGSIQAATQVFVATVGRRWLGVAWLTNGTVTVAVPAWARGIGVEGQLERALA